MVDSQKEGTSNTLFISYSRVDATIATEIEELVEMRGMQVYRDKEIARGGGKWKEKIYPLAATCDLFVLVWSKSAAESIPVMEELLHALDNSRTIVPYLLDGNRPSLLKKDFQEYSASRIDPVDFVERILPQNPYRPIGNVSMGSVLKTYRRVVSEDVGSFPVLTLSRNHGIEQIINLKIDLDISKANQGVAPEEPQKNVGSDPLDILSILDLPPKDGILLVGHPGSGKSTSLQYIAAQMVIADDSSIIAGIPILLRCSNYNPERHKTFEDFIYNSLSLEFGNDLAMGMREQKVAEYSQTILLIDGLDELRSGTTTNFITSLKKFLDDPTVNTKRIVLSSRYDAYRLYQNHFGRWEQVLIRPLEIEQVTDFIKKWFGDKKQQDSLLRQIEEPRMAELSRRPFLLALMCALHSDRIDLGENRSDLYLSAIRYLESRVKNAVFVEKRNFRRFVLNSLAIHMLHLGTTKIHAKLASAITSLTHYQEMGSELKELECQECLKDLTRDLGITQKTTTGYTFVHKSFLEFLAAEKLHRIPNGIDGAIEYASVPRWEEPIRLLIGLKENVSEQVDIIKKIWVVNKALSLRSLTEAKKIDLSFIESLINNTPKDDLVRMLRSFDQSFKDIDEQTKKRLVLETCEPILKLEQDSEILYYAIQQILKFDPDDKQEILMKNYGVKSKALRDTLINNTDAYFKFVEIPGGEFVMGDNCAKDNIEKPAHTVTLDSFQLMKFTLTNLAFELITGAKEHHRNEVSIFENQPVVALNWFDAWLTAFRVGCKLPTEAEWEYAARAGSGSNWCFGDDVNFLAEYARFEPSDQSNVTCDPTGTNGPWKVGSGKANRFGLHDMHGNVWEWCSDWLESYSDEKQSNPTGPQEGEAKVRRGGGFAYHSRGCRSAFRWGNDPRYKFKDIGVRFVLDKYAIEKGW